MPGTKMRRFRTTMRIGMVLLSGILMGCGYVGHSKSKSTDAAVRRDEQAEALARHFGADTLSGLENQYSLEFSADTAPGLISNLELQDLRRDSAGAYAVASDGTVFARLRVSDVLLKQMLADSSLRQLRFFSGVVKITDMKRGVLTLEATEDGPRDVTSGEPVISPSDEILLHGVLLGYVSW